MRRILLILTLLVTIVTTSFAQGRGKDEMRRDIREYKMKYLAQEIELKPENQKKFFELYEQLDRERQAISSEARATERRVKEDKNATDADFARASEAVSQARAKVNDLEKEYDKKFSEFLTPKQIYKLHEAEDTFRQKMREMRAEKRGGKAKR